MSRSKLRELRSAGWPSLDSSSREGRHWTNHRRVQREDFALQDVPEEYRRWTVPSLFGVTLAIPSALVFFATGGALVSAYGTRNLIDGLVIATVFIGAIGYFWTDRACRSGLDSDLMSIRAGFGIVGSAVTSLIYSANFVMFFALEESIIVDAVQARYDVPKWPLLLALGLVVVLLTWHGVSTLTRLMWLTLPLFVGFTVWLMVEASGVDSTGSFWAYGPPSRDELSALPPIVGVLLAFIVNATVAADIGRFIPERRRSFGAKLLGVVLQVVCFFGSTMIGAWVTFKLGGNANPGVYLVSVLGTAGVLFVLVTQTRINTINVYSGSLALSNFFARSVKVVPGRHVWVVATTAVATLLTLTGLYKRLLDVLTFESVFVMGWVMAVTSYLIFNPRLTGRDSLADRTTPIPTIQAEGVVSLGLALAVSVPMAFGALGQTGRTWAPMASGAVAFMVVPLVILWKRSRSRPRRVARTDTNAASPFLHTTFPP